MIFLSTNISYRCNKKKNLRYNLYTLFFNFYSIKQSEMMSVMSLKVITKKVNKVMFSDMKCERKGVPEREREQNLKKKEKARTKT